MIEEENLEMEEDKLASKKSSKKEEDMIEEENLEMEEDKLADVR